MLPRPAPWLLTQPCPQDRPARLGNDLDRLHGASRGCSLVHLSHNLSAGTATSATLTETGLAAAKPRQPQLWPPRPRKDLVRRVDVLGRCGHGLRCPGRNLRCRGPDFDCRLPRARPRPWPQRPPARPPRRRGLNLRRCGKSLGPTVATGSNTVATTFGHQGCNLSCRGRDLGPLGYNLPAVIRALAALFSEA